MRPRLTAAVLAVCFLNTSAAMADAQPNFPEFLKGVEADLTQKNIPVDLFYRAFGEDRTPDQKALERIQAQPESKFSFEKYRSSMLSNERINKGRTLFDEHKDTLKRISAVYGVPPEVIVAMWGVESFYGRWPGQHRIVRSLATLAYDSHRQTFFRKELMAAMEILNDGHIEPENMTGSWAGAMGQCQFMPTSFLAYAADGDGDGHKNIWNDPADVFASAANYLNKHGWKKDEPWGQRVVLTKNLPRDLKVSERGLSSEMPVEAFEKMGVIASHGGLPPKGTQAKLFMPEGPSKKSYLVYHNFDVVMAWNRASYFAYSALTLADSIAKR